jgi:small subunit ribosomal protein S4
MQIGAKYKKARRLGTHLFEKTQSQKFNLSLQRRTKLPRRPSTDYGQVMLEKQKARFTYLVNEKQFKRIAKTVAGAGTKNPSELFYQTLETRLDNVVYRAGIAPTRLAARQLVAHGHINLNGVRNGIPSTIVTNGDIVSIRPISATKAVFAKLAERAKEVKVPTWIKADVEKNTYTIQGKPTLVPSEMPFDLSRVLEFYSR